MAWKARADPAPARTPNAIALPAAQPSRSTSSCTSGPRSPLTTPSPAPTGPSTRQSRAPSSQGRDEIARGAEANGAASSTASIRTSSVVPVSIRSQVESFSAAPTMRVPGSIGTSGKRSPTIPPSPGATSSRSPSVRTSPPASSSASSPASVEDSATNAFEQYELVATELGA